MLSIASSYARQVVAWLKRLSAEVLQEPPGSQSLRKCRRTIRRVNPDVADVRVAPESKVLGWREVRDEINSKRRLTFGAALFEGVLEIMDAEVFRQTLAEGIGSGKAYGFGLLSIAPAEVNGTGSS